MRDKAPLPCGAAYRARKQARLVLHAMFPQMQMRLMEAIVLDTDFNMQAATEVALGMDPRLHGITEYVSKIEQCSKIVFTINRL